MNVKFILFCFFQTIYFSNLLSQSTRIFNWGNRYETRGLPISDLRFIESDNEHYYLLDYNAYIIPKKSVTRHKILKFEFNNNCVGEYDANIRFKKKRLSINKIIHTNKNVFALAPFFDYSHKFHLIASKFKNGKLQIPTSKFEHNFKVRKEPTFTTFPFNQDIEGAISLSRDSSKVVFINQNNLYDKKSKSEEQVIAVFDNEMNLRWERTIVLPYKDHKFITSKIFIDNSGDNIYLLGIYNPGKKNDTKEYKVYHITQESEKEIPIQIPSDLFITTLELILNYKNDQVKIFGVYSERKTGVLSGVFSGMIESHRSIFELNRLYKLNSKEDKIFKKDLRLYKNQISISELNINHFDNIQMLIELIGQKRNQNNDQYNKSIHDYGQSISYNHTRDFNSMLFCTIDKEEKFMNDIFIKRTQSTYDKKGFSICNYDDKTFIFYDTRLTKKEAKKLKLRHALLDFLTCLKIVDSNGELVKEIILLRSSDSKIMFNELLSFTLNEKLYLGGKNSNYELKIINNSAVYDFGIIKINELMNQ